MTIEITLQPTNVFMRFRCTVCGGFTDKDPVTAENRDEDILVCEQCIKAGDIDARLLKHADGMAEYSAFLRALIGQLKVPTHAEWQAAWERADMEYAYGENPTEAEISAYRAERERERAMWSEAAKAQALARS